MLTVTLSELAEFPARLARLYQSIPASFRNWTPESWAGIPSEELAALSQICHVRDIEIDGYHVRLRRMLEEHTPDLESLDGYELARTRRYEEEDSAAVLEVIRTARERTLVIARSLTEAQLVRTAQFEGHKLTVKGLLHLLCSHDQQHLAGLQWLLARAPLD
jgi:hypothetical protein